MRKLIALVALAAACTTGESDDALGDARYEIDVNCFTEVCPANPTSMTRGDTATLMVILQDPTPDSTALPLVRPICGVNFELRRGGVLIRTFPEAPTCPDSTEAGGENWPSIIGVSRIFLWAIPNDLPVGNYTLTSKILVDPAVDRQIRFSIQ